MTTEPRVAFVTVVEPNGAIEAEVLLLAESLRRWGGRLAGAPIVCVSPRFHLPISRRTLARFDEMGIAYLDRNRNHRFAWYGFLNKALAMAEARRAVDAETLVWLDSDALILDEPSAYLADDGDLAAIFTSMDLATTGPADPIDAYWRAACERLGADLDAMPWIEVDGRRVRYCIQAGIFRARRASPIIDHYLANLEALMDWRTVPSAHGLFFLETMALTLAPFTGGASWAELPRSHNFVIPGPPDGGRVEGLESARVLHYQGWLYPERRRGLLSALGRCWPDRLAWLEERLPALDAARPPILSRLLRKGLSTVRRRQAQRFLAGCRSIDNGRATAAALGR